MELKIKAYAGTLESSDVYIIAEPNKSGIEINLESSVKEQFGEEIERVVLEVLESNNVKNVKLTIDDRGALNSVIKGRLQAVLMRSAQKEDYNWN